MSIPVGTYPNDTPDRLMVGDLHDDDGRVLDSQVESQAEPPKPDDLPTVKVRPLREPKPISRLMTSTIDLQVGWAPMMLLPADPWRESLQISVFSLLTPGDKTVEHVMVSDDAGKLSSIGGGYVLYHGQPYSASIAHTGPVWIAAPDIAGPCRVSVVAVTR